MATINPSAIPQNDEISTQHAEVIVVGAGPVGLFLALKLAKEGIDTIVLEAERQVLQSPRATTYTWTPQNFEPIRA